MSGRLYKQPDGRLAIAIRYDPKVVEQIRSEPVLKSLLARLTKGPTT